MILEVGCSNSTNKHLWRTQFASEGGYADVSVDIKCPKINYKIPNFILADANHLPFKNNTFGNVVSYHVIEHVSDPYRFFKELVRVAENVKIVCPHRYSAHAKAKGQHISFLNAKWFMRAFEAQGSVLFNIRTTQGFWGRPDELFAEGHKVVMK